MVFDVCDNNGAFSLLLFPDLIPYPPSPLREGEYFLFVRHVFTSLIGEVEHRSGEVFLLFSCSLRLPAEASAQAGGKSDRGRLIHHFKIRVNGAVFASLALAFGTAAGIA